MMKSIVTVYVTTALCVFASCKNSGGTFYAIRDFNKTLQPYLVKIVTAGIVQYDSAMKYLEQNATDKDLKQLSQSEHPILRAVALHQMLQRPSLDHYQLMMDHLDDTAIVPVNDGEFGINNYRVSDYMLAHGSWKDTAAKNETIGKIILEHNCLHSAYSKVVNVKPDEKLYASIKEMAFRKRKFQQ